MNKRNLLYVVLGLNIFSQELYADNDIVKVCNLASESNLINFDVNERFVLLPVQDDAPEAKIGIVVNNELQETVYNIRMAREKVDYYVPLDLLKFYGKNINLDIQGVPQESVCWNNIKVSDTFDYTNKEKLRPHFHHTPAYGWMNDPNGMFYKDGVFHLYFQYNPYGSIWGNMHWGHSTSTDLVNWQHESVALAPDAWGAIFSGSCVVDTENTAGFGEGAVIAFYTSAKQTPWGDCQTQSIAYSLDDGKSFTKFDRNPVLTSTEKDFRDPKVFWYAPNKHWVMILAVGQHMEIYSSENLKDWKWESNFGEEYGCHDGVWECPDLVELPIEGTKGKKWVLICNINPGGPFGGSATQYFIGDFDGRTFTNSYPNETKWMDYGKDHYATVTWHNAPDGRCIAIGWMSNWQYANVVPTKQYRSANTIARDLTLYENGGNLYLKSAPSVEINSLRSETKTIKSVDVVKEESISLFPQCENGAYEIEFTINPQRSKKVVFSLLNSMGENIVMAYDVESRKLSFDRTESGMVSFSKDFSSITETSTLKSKELNLRLFVDKTSIEAFIENGKYVMTNCVFPTEPYNMLKFKTAGDNYKVKNIKIHKIN